MTRSLKIRAYAKLNLGLVVEGKRANGYHDLDMVMQSVSLYDTITIARLEEPGIRFSCDAPGIPGSDNLCVRAVNALARWVGAPLPVAMTLEKRIPAQAGMAGGSADGAAVLAGLNQLFALGLSEEELLPLAAGLGADMPFCLTGGTKRVRGFGERLLELPPLPDCVILVAKPGEGVPTAESFARYDALGEKPRLSVEPLVRALLERDLRRAAGALCNGLECCAGLDAIPRLVGKMEEMGALGSRMTGSGSAVFGIFEGEREALACREALGKEAAFTALCRPAAAGWEIEGRL